MGFPRGIPGSQRLPCGIVAGSLQQPKYRRTPICYRPSRSLRFVDPSSFMFVAMALFDERSLGLWESMLVPHAAWCSRGEGCGKEDVAARGWMIDMEDVCAAF